MEQTRSLANKLRAWKLQEWADGHDQERLEVSEMPGSTSATRELWRVEADTSVKDPREADDAAWDGCRVLAFTARFMGGRTALIDADSGSAARLRAVRGVRTVDRSTDRRYFDDRSESQVNVLNGCLSSPE